MSTHVTGVHRVHSVHGFMKYTVYRVHDVHIEKEFMEYIYYKGSWSTQSTYITRVCLSTHYRRGKNRVHNTHVAGIYSTEVPENPLPGINNKHLLEQGFTEYAYFRDSLYTHSTGALVYT